MRLLDLVFDGFLHYNRLLVHLPVSFVEAGEENLVEGGVCCADDDLNGGDEEVDQPGAKPTQLSFPRVDIHRDQCVGRLVHQGGCLQGCGLLLSLHCYTILIMIIIIMMLMMMVVMVAFFSASIATQS